MEELGFLFTQGGGMAIVIALVALFKRYVPERFYPLMAVIVGMGFLSAVYAYTGKDVVAGLIQGLILGLGAAGLYDQKAIIKE